MWLDSINCHQFILDVKLIRQSLWLLTRILVGSNPSTFTNLSAIRRTIRCGMLTHAKVPSVVRR
jgi:hypothetical protein